MLGWLVIMHSCLGLLMIANGKLTYHEMTAILCLIVLDAIRRKPKGE